MSQVLARPRRLVLHPSIIITRYPRPTLSALAIITVPLPGCMHRALPAPTGSGLSHPSRRPFPHLSQFMVRYRVFLSTLCFRIIISWALSSSHHRLLPVASPSATSATLFGFAAAVSHAPSRPPVETAGRRARPQRYHDWDFLMPKGHRSSDTASPSAKP